MFKSRCPFCFTPFSIDEQQVCPSCSKHLENHNPSISLPFGTCLNDHIVIGKYLSQDGEGIEYEGLLGIEKHEPQKVIIREYFPQIEGITRDENGLLVPADGSEVVYKTNLMDFIDLYSALVSLQEQPGLVKAFECAQANGTAYGVIERVKGIPLERYLAGSKKHIRVQEALKLLTPVAEGVRSMHHRGMTHLGISPDTILITPEGETKLGSYGTITLRAKGGAATPKLLEGYSAPEQYSSDMFCDCYTDVYALAAVFYRALTGIKPQDAHLRVANDKLEPVSALNNNVPIYFSSAVGRAMRVAPNERFSDLDSFLEVIGSIEHHHLTSKETGRQPNRLNQPKSRSDYRFVLLMTVLALICFLLLVLCFFQLAGNHSDSESSSVSVVSSNIVEEREVPLVVGLNYNNLPVYKGFSFFVLKQEYSDLYEAGIIISQTPSAGLPVDTDTEIGVTVSLGPELVKMPNIIGFTKENAVAELNNRGIRFSLLVRENNGEFVSGCVAETDVLPETTFDPDKIIVNVYIAGDRMIEILQDAENNS